MSAAATIGIESPSRILVRGVNWLGDAVMSTPALLRLRERHPKTEIILLSHQKLAPLWLGHPAIDRVVSFAPKEGLLTMARRIRAEAFPIGLVFPNSLRSALELWLGGVPNRIGLATRGRHWWLTQSVAADPRAIRMRKRTPAEIRARIAPGGVPEPLPGNDSHQTHHYLRLTAALGADATPLAPRLAITEQERNEARQRLMAALTTPIGGPEGRKWIGINPGAEYGPAKRWPAESFGRLVGELRALGCLNSVVILGGPADIGIALEVVRFAGSPVVNLAGKTNLRELMAVLAELSVLVTNDTGPMHIAAALGVPVVVPFGSTSPELTGPGLPGDRRHRLLRAGAPCAPCFLRECPIDLRCLTQITPKMVADAVTDSLKTPDLMEGWWPPGMGKTNRRAD